MSTLAPKPSASPFLELKGLSKHFGGVVAVAAVDLEVATGEVVALVGHNGAGKTTLVELLSGAIRPDAGEIRVRGAAVRLRSPRDAQGQGIATLHQSLALADNLDAAANVFLGRERRSRWGTLDDRAMERATREVLERLQPGFEPGRAPVRWLSGGERQLVAIARALLHDARLLLMDEPTAALGPRETERVASLIERLTADGLGIVLVSHDLHGVLALSDRIAVMRGGHLVALRASADLSHDELVSLVLGGS